MLIHAVVIETSLLLQHILLFLYVHPFCHPVVVKIYFLLYCLCVWTVRLRDCVSILDGLSHAVGGVSGQSVVQVPDEVVAVLLCQGHEGPAHHDELHLIHTVTQLLQLRVDMGYRGTGEEG